MDAPYYNGEPGAMPYDRDHDPRDEPEPELTCANGDGQPAVQFEGGRGFCLACWEARQEPPDSDGEDFRGTEADAFERDQMVEYQRLK